MDISRIKTGQVQENQFEKDDIKNSEKSFFAKDEVSIVQVENEKDVVYEKSNASGNDKTLVHYGEQAKVKYAKDIAAVEEMKRQLDKSMKDTYLQMALDALGDQQTGLKAKLQSILKERASEISPETIEQAKVDIGADGYYGVEETAKRLFDFATALSGGDPEKAGILKNALLSGFKQAEKMWGDELPEISKKTKERALELFDEWENGGATAKDDSPAV